MLLRQRWHHCPLVALSATIVDNSVWKLLCGLILEYANFLE